MLFDQIMERSENEFFQQAMHLYLHILLALVPAQYGFI